MENREIKEQINDVIDSIPEEILEDVLEYLKTVKNRSRDKIHLAQNLRKILEEDKLLLKRLAQ